MTEQGCIASCPKCHGSRNGFRYERHTLGYLVTCSFCGWSVHLTQEGTIYTPVEKRVSGGNGVRGYKVDAQSREVPELWRLVIPEEFLSQYVPVGCGDCTVLFHGSEQQTHRPRLLDILFVNPPLVLAPWERSRLAKAIRDWMSRECPHLDISRTSGQASTLLRVIYS